MRTEDCVLCGLPVEDFLDQDGEPVRWEASGAGFGFATDTIVWFARVRCAGGHVYDVEEGDIQLPLW